MQCSFVGARQFPANLFRHTGPIRGVFFQEPHGELAVFLRKRAGVHVDALEMPPDEFLHLLAMEGRLAYEDLMEKDAERVEIASGGGRVSLEKLRRQVFDRPRELLALGSSRPGEAEINQLHPGSALLPGDPDVLRFQILVYKAPGVDVIEGCEHLV